MSWTVMHTLILTSSSYKTTDTHAHVSACYTVPEVCQTRLILCEETGPTLMFNSDKHRDAHICLCRHTFPAESSAYCPPNIITMLTNSKPLSSFLCISLTFHREVDKPQKVHQFEGATDHQEDPHSLQPLHLPLVLEEQMHPFLLPLPLF